MVKVTSRSDVARGGFKADFGWSVWWHSTQPITDLPSGLYCLNACESWSNLTSPYSERLSFARTKLFGIVASAGAASFAETRSGCADRVGADGCSKPFSVPELPLRATTTNKRITIAATHKIAVTANFADLFIRPLFP